MEFERKRPKFPSIDDFFTQRFEAACLEYNTLEKVKTPSYRSQIIENYQDQDMKLQVVPEEEKEIKGQNDSHFTFQQQNQGLEEKKQNIVNESQGEIEGDQSREESYEEEKSGGTGFSSSPEKKRIGFMKNFGKGAFMKQFDKLFVTPTVKVFTYFEWKEIFEKQVSIQSLNQKKLKDSLIAGIPTEFRGEFWILACQCNEQKSRYASSVFQNLISMVNEDSEFCIGKDLPRTLTFMKEFNVDPLTGKNKLYNVLKAYANFDHKVGYCQGINYLAAMLLTHVEDEQDAFWCLNYIMEKHNWREIFDEETPKLMELLDQVDKHLREKQPKLSKYLQKEQDFQLSAIFSSLFITLFVYDVDHQIATRIFELFIVEGETIILKLLFKMIKLKEKKLMKVHKMELLQYLREGMISECMNEYSLEYLLK